MKGKMEGKTNIIDNRPGGGKELAQNRNKTIKIQQAEIINTLTMVSSQFFFTGVVDFQQTKYFEVI